MTIKKQWLIALIITSIISVTINTVLLNQLIKGYFVQVTQENYNTHLDQIIEISKSILEEDNLSISQREILLKAHLSDPIIGISLYDVNGIEITKVNIEIFDSRYMMNNSMMNFMMGQQSQEVDAVELVENGETIGSLLINRQSSIANSMATRAFSMVLIINSLISFLIVLIIATLVGIIISKKMSKDLHLVLDQAIDIEMGKQSPITYSNVIEIKALQQNLDNLNNKLKLRQKSRKTLVDELMHQANTPLTILKTHLEAYKDNVLEMTPGQIQICESQIESISAIIKDMENIIDIQQTSSNLKFEKFEINELLKQIASGLRPMFEKKGIKLKLNSTKKINITTDKSKLSQSIYNIVTNAYKFSSDNSIIKIEYKKIDNQLEIKIHDNGPGISSEDQKHIFDAYYRGNDTIITPGEGLGLFIAKDNLEKIDGTISVESKLGVGSIFKINIPIESR